MEFIYIGLVFLLILQRLHSQGKISKSCLCICVCLYLFLASAIKSETLTGDLISYSYRYRQLELSSYETFFEKWQAGIQKDPLFYVVAKFLSSIGISVWGWFALIAFFFATCASTLIKKYSPIPFISCLFLVSLEIFAFSMSGLRQAVALGFIMLAYPCIQQRNLNLYLLCIVAAWSFHSSALIFLPAYWLSQINVSVKQLIVVSIAVCVCMVLPSVIRRFLGIMAWNNSIAAYGDTKVSLTWSGFIIQSSIFAFCYVFRNSVKSYQQETLRLCLNCMAVGLCFQAMASVIAEAFRAAYYYNICNTIAVPIVIAAQQKYRDRVIMGSVISAVLFLYMLWKQAYFDFIYCWEQNI